MATSDADDPAATGREVPIDWNGRSVAAWVPAPLAARDLALSEATARATERACAVARSGSEALSVGWEALVRLMLRAEGIASSFVEGVRAPAAEVALAELEPAAGGDAAWVADNLAATLDAIAEARSGGPLRVASLHRWHRRLMAGASPLPARSIGAIRDLPGWIGGTSPLDAALVVVPPALIAPLLDDLVAFANSTDLLDPVTQAAVAHAQFELIHPYADGNGRLGRILVAWILTRRLALHTPPPLSVRIAADIGGYLSGLTLFRLGHPDPWVRWFADALLASANAERALIDSARALRVQWEARLADVRSDAAAHRALALLPAHPVLDAATLARELEISERAARGALHALRTHGILEPFQPPRGARGRPARWYLAGELLALADAVGGHTQVGGAPSVS